MRSLIPALMLAVTLMPAVAHAQQTTGSQEPARIVRGQVLVKLDSLAKSDDDARAQLASLESAKGLKLKLHKRSVLGWVVVDVEAVGEDDTNAAVDKLKREKHVVAAQPVHIKHAYATPNDPLFPELWGFAGIGLPQAWDTTQGTSTQRIGLIDSGINRDHIDLIEHDFGGFDFVSDPSKSGDGDGRDADYTDADVGGVFHGSHVAGTMVASANDNIGVPGINWNAGLITARALGVGGAGSTVDIAEAAIWLADGHVDGVPDIGANKVSVINMSLGGDEPCSQFESEVYSQVISAGVTVVASAGNSGNDVPAGSPANCPGVISVGAAGPDFSLAFFSNFDPNVTVVAPGGDGSDANDPAHDILSVDGATTDGYKAIDGTSMAAPHVTGVISLMQAVNPKLSPAQIKNLLTQSPFTCQGCNNIAFLDAPSAVQLAQQTTGELPDTTSTPTDPASSSGAAQCPPNATLSADGTQCLCNPGFVVNSTQDGCVATSGGGAGGGSGGGGGSTTSGDCPAHSHDTPDGQFCQCDPGFVVNDAQTACVAPPSNGGGNAPSDTCSEDRDCKSGEICERGACVEANSRSSRDDTNASQYGGCSAGGAPTSTLALIALLLLARVRRASGSRRADKLTRSVKTTTAASRMLSRVSLIALAPVAALCFTGVGCAHMVRIESSPGADIYVNDQHVGTSPVTYQETTGTSDPVKVTVKQHGKEKTVMVPRADVDMGAVGAGAAAGVGGCLASNVVLGVAGFIFPPCWLAFPVSWAMLGVGPGYGWWYGHKMPDNIQIDMKDATPALANANDDQQRDHGAPLPQPGGALARY